MKTTNQIDREANERKAREIANDCCTHICLADCSAESYFGSENDCYKAAMEAMSWKDEQEIEFLQSLMFQASTQQALNVIINNRIKLLKGEQL